MSKSPTYFIKSFSSGKSQFKQIQITPAYTAASTTAGLVFAHLRRILSFSGAGVRGLEERENSPSHPRPHSYPPLQTFPQRGFTLSQENKSLWPHMKERPQLAQVLNTEGPRWWRYFGKCDLPRGSRFLGVRPWVCVLSLAIFCLAFCFLVSCEVSNASTHVPHQVTVD